MYTSSRKPIKLYLKTPKLYSEGSKKGVDSINDRVTTLQAKVLLGLGRGH